MVSRFSAIELARIDIDGPLPVWELPRQKNRSRRIDQINAFCGLPMGSPYCAAGLSLAFYDVVRFGAPRGEIFPYTGSSQAIRRHFEAKGLLTFDPDALLEMKGAIAGWTNEDDPSRGHVFLIEQRLTTDGKVVRLGTLEYNTSPRTKSRDGEGAFRLVRDVRDRDFWYCDVSSYAGGVWWR